MKFWGNLFEIIWQIEKGMKEKCGRKNMKPEGDQPAEIQSTYGIGCELYLSGRFLERILCFEGNRIVMMVTIIFALLGWI